MTKKKSSTRSKSDSKDPYLELLEWETGGVSRKPPVRPRGRPRSLFPKVELSVSMSPVQVKTLKQIRLILEERFGRRVTLGNLVDFMVICLLEDLQPEFDPSGEVIFTIPETVNSFTALTDFLVRKRK